MGNRPPPDPKVVDMVAEAIYAHRERGYPERVHVAWSNATDLQKTTAREMALAALAVLAQSGLLRQWSAASLVIPSAGDPA